MAESEIALQPVAHPTDQYAAPEVRRKLPGYQLGQLANSLSEFGGGMSQIAARFGSAYRENSISGGAADVEKLGLQNMQAFHDAVQSGKIDKADNPWYLVGVQQQLARNQAYGSAGTLQQAYEQSGFKDQDDPQGFSNFVNQHLGQYLQGKDAYQTKAMQPILEQTRQEALARYTNDRRVSREQTLNTSTATNWRTLMDRYSADVNPDGSPTKSEDMVKRFGEISDNLQSDLNRTSMLMGRNAAVELMARTAKEAAIGKLDATFAVNLLNRIKTPDGIPLAKIADVRAMLTQLPLEVQRLRVSKEAGDEELQNLAIEKSWHQLAGAIKQQADAQWGGDFSKVRLTDEELWKNQPGENRLRWMKEQAAYAENKANLKNALDVEKLQPLKESFYHQVLDGTLTPDSRNSAIMAAIKSGVMGEQMVDHFEYFLRSAHYGTFIWGDTRPETKVQLNQAIDDGSLTIEHLLRMATDHQISQQDFYRATDQITFGKGEGGSGLGLGLPGSGRGGSDMQRLEQLVAFGLTDPANKTGIDFEKLRESRDFNVAYGQAQDEYRQRVHELQSDPKYQTMTVDQKREAMNHAIDVISQAHGGADYKTFSEYKRKFDPLDRLRNEGKPTTQPTTKPADAAKPEPEVTLPGKVGELLTKSDKVLAANIDHKTLRAAMLAPSEKNNTELFSSDPGYYGHYRDGAGGGITELFHTATWEHDDLHQLMNLRGYMPTASYYRYQRSDGVVVDERANAMANEIALARKASQRIADLQPVAEVATKELQQRLDAWKAKAQGGDNSMSYADKARLAQLSSYVNEYRLLRRQVGFTPDEVSKMGTDAWQHVPMFVNELDFKQRGQAVMDKLKVTDPDERNKFALYQLKLTAAVRRQDDLLGLE